MKLHALYIVLLQKIITHPSPNVGTGKSPGARYFWGECSVSKINNNNNNCSVQLLHIQQFRTFNRSKVQKFKKTGEGSSQTLEQIFQGVGGSKPTSLPQAGLDIF